MLHFLCTRHARRRQDFLRLNIFLFGMQLFFLRHFSILIVTLQLLLGLSLKHHHSLVAHLLAMPSTRDPGTFTLDSGNCWSYRMSLGRAPRPYPRPAEGALSLILAT